MSTVSFKYDPFGRRIYKQSPTFTSLFAYDGDNLVETVNSSGSVVSRYTQSQDIDEPLAELCSSTTSYYEADGLGSVTSLTSSAGTLANTYAYDSFGRLTASTGSVANPFQYTSREFDPETGLYFFRARYADAGTGRFLSEDPIGFAGGVDLYTYVSNSSPNLHDPTGDDGTIVVIGNGAISVTTTITVTTIGTSGGAVPVLSLIAGGSGSGSAGGPVGALAGVIAAVGTYDAIELRQLCIAYGVCQPDNEPGSPASPNSNCDKNNNEPDCKKASQFHLDNAGISDSHSFKQDVLGRKAPISRYDICACKDGSIVIKAQGQCGSPGPGIPTGLHMEVGVTHAD